MNHVCLDGNGDVNPEYTTQETCLGSGGTWNEEDIDKTIGTFSYNGEVYHPFDACKYHGNDEGVPWKPPGSALRNYIRDKGVDIAKEPSPRRDGQSTLFNLVPECHADSNPILGKGIMEGSGPSGSHGVCFNTGFKISKMMKLLD